MLGKKQTISRSDVQHLEPFSKYGKRDGIENFLLEKKKIVLRRRSVVTDDGKSKEDICVVVPAKWSYSLMRIFRKYSNSGRMTLQDFNELIAKLSLFDLKKQADLIEAIFQGYERETFIGFDKFMKTLHRIAKYRCRSMGTSEQEALNSLVCYMLETCPVSASEEGVVVHDVGIQEEPDKETETIVSEINQYTQVDWTTSNKDSQTISKEFSDACIQAVKAVKSQELSAVIASENRGMQMDIEYCHKQTDTKDIPTIVSEDLSEDLSKDLSEGFSVLSVLGAKDISEESIPDISSIIPDENITLVTRKSCEINKLLESVKVSNGELAAVAEVPLKTPENVNIKSSQVSTSVDMGREIISSETTPTDEIRLQTNKTDLENSNQNESSPSRRTSALSEGTDLTDVPSFMGDKLGKIFDEFSIWESSDGVFLIDEQYFRFFCRITGIPSETKPLDKIISGTFQYAKRHGAPGIKFLNFVQILKLISQVCFPDLPPSEAYEQFFRHYIESFSSSDLYSPTKSLVAPKPQILKSEDVPVPDTWGGYVPDNTKENPIELAYYEDDEYSDEEYVFPTPNNLKDFFPVLPFYPYCFPGPC